MISSRTNQLQPRRAAFTLFELLVVVGIIILLMILTVPSFATLVKSNNYTAAVNQLSGTLEAARERAIARNTETAVAVLFDLETERTSLHILDRAGRGALGLSTEPDSGAQYASVFVPAPSTSPTELPEGVMIFGLSTHHIVPDGDDIQDSIESIVSGSALYTSRVITDGTHNPDELGVRTTAWYAGSVIPDPDDPNVMVNTWLVPRNDPRVYMDPTIDGRDIELPVREPKGVSLDELWSLIRDTSDDPPGLKTDDVMATSYMRHAQSFMIRFSPQGQILAVSADTTQTDQSGYAFLEFPGNPVATGSAIPPEMQGLAFDAFARFDPEATPRNQTEVTPSPFPYEHAGANPEVVLRSVSRLAVVELQELYRGTGVFKPWLLHATITDPDSQAPWPDEYAPGDGPVISSFDEELDRLMISMSEWVDQNAVLVEFSRFSGRVMKR